MTDTEIQLVEAAIVADEDAAHQNFRNLCRHKAEVETGFLVIARLLKENRDMGYWKILGHDSFESFLADPELAFRRSTAYKLIRHTQLYEDDLHIPEEQLVAIGSRRLQIISSVVKDDPQEWLAKAQFLSKSDLEDEVREARGAGGTSVQSSPPKISPSSPAPLSMSTWVDMVKASPCCICDRSPSDPAHFPRTKGAGADDWKVIPLCRFCHTESHAGGMKWLWTNRIRIFDWFYSLCVKGEK